MTDERARAILDSAENIESIVNQEVGRRMAEQLNSTLDLLHKVARAVKAAENHITALSVGYSRGSLPKAKP
jgi:hypothetical protein